MSKTDKTPTPVSSSGGVEPRQMIVDLLNNAINKDELRRRFMAWEYAPKTSQQTIIRAALFELNDALDDGLCNSGTPGFDSARLGRAQDKARAALSATATEGE